ncbi:MAG: hypothetical protein D6704_12595 [Nitrospirae bacterium]|nr:MAG: hypothetical protein D6704_12595 [Nitrospirota bacterium]
MGFSECVIELLRGYMQDLVEQAKQEEQALCSFGYTTPPYRVDHAISDLLAILDDRIESEGVQVGLAIEFLHEMWTLCNEAEPRIQEIVWLEQHLDDQPCSKARTRELTYRALLAYLERYRRDHA